MTPGSTTATWLAVSISRIASIRSKETTIPPDTGMAAPESPVPEPRAVSGTRSATAACTTAATSSAVPGRTTRRRRTASLPRDSSWVTSSSTRAPTSTWAAPTRSISRSSITGERALWSSVTLLHDDRTLARAGPERLPEWAPAPRVGRLARCPRCPACPVCVRWSSRSTTP